MKNALSMILGIVLLAVGGYARTPDAQPVPHVEPESASPVEPGGSATGSRPANATTMFSPYDSVPDPDATVAPTQCRAMLTSASDHSDECWECERGCFEAWRECRWSCGPTWYGACHDRCTSDLEWCLDTYCSSVCD